MTRWMTCASALAMAAALSGCLTTGGVLPGAFSVSGEGGPYVNRAKVAEGDVDLKAGPKLLVDNSGSARERLIDMPETQGQLQAMVEKLHAKWPNAQGAPPRVLVRADPSYNAAAWADGVIIVNLGLLEKADTDSELAFVLGHEIAHGQLGHFKKAETMREQRKMLSNLAGAYEVGALLSETDFRLDQVGTGKQLSANVNEADLRKRLAESGAVHDALRLTADALLEPGWGRNQEDQADVAGLDLMVLAGYDTGGANQVFQKFAVDWQSNVGAAKRLEGALTSTFQNLMADQNFAAMLSSGNTAAAGGDLKSQLIKNLRGQAIAAAVDWLDDTHRKPDVREKGLDEYLQKAYANEPLGDAGRTTLDAIRGSKEFQEALKTRDAVMASLNARQGGDAGTAKAEIGKALAGPFKSNAFVQYEAARVAELSGDGKRAAAHYGAALSGAHPSPIAYHDFSAFALNAGRPPEASQIAGLGEARFADPGFFAPTRMRIAQATGDAAGVKAAFNVCVADTREHIIAQCRAAASGLQQGALSAEDLKKLNLTTQQPGQGLLDAIKVLDSVRKATGSGSE